MGPSVSVKLDNREYFLRFGVRSARIAASALQNAMPARAEKLTVGDAAILVMRQDLDAIVAFMWYGLKHGEQENLKMEQVERWLENAADAGREMSDFSIPILKALEEAHLVTINWSTSVKPDDDKAPNVGAYIDPGDPLARRPLAAVSHESASRE